MLASYRKKNLKTLKIYCFFRFWLTLCCHLYRHIKNTILFTLVILYSPYIKALGNSYELKSMGC